jgi:rare lipoprotein A
MTKIICSLVSLYAFFCFANISLHGSPLVKNTKIQLADTPVVKYGVASYYAKKFSGRKTSTGAYYDSSILTAACNVLPLGTWVKVTNLRNNKSVIVEINDHMHPKNKRLIDLSKAAARKLGYISRGITRVKVEVLPKKTKMKGENIKIKD